MGTCMSSTSQQLNAILKGMDGSRLEGDEDIHGFPELELDKRGFRDEGFERDLSTLHANLIVESLIDYSGNNGRK